MKYIIHIGQSKTGTSSLQSFLSNNRKKLTKQGFLYPDVFIGNNALNTSEHNALADELAGFTRHPGLSSKEYFEQFKSQAKDNNCNKIILSAESFFGTPQIWRVSDENEFWEVHNKKVKNLAQFIQDNEIEIIVYLRHQSDWFESGISQIIRTEILLEHHLYENDIQLFDLLKPHMDYQRILNIWGKHFHEKSISVIPFDKDILKNKNIIDDFCSRISVKTNGLCATKDRDNVTWDRRYIWLKNELNKTTKSKAKERLIISIINSLNINKRKIEKYRISNDLRNQIHENYVSNNKDLCSEYKIQTPNILTTLKPLNDFLPLTEQEKKDAYNNYKKSLYSIKSIILYFRYSGGALLRKNLPSLNAFLKKFIK